MAESRSVPGYEVRQGRVVNPEGCEINAAFSCNLSCRACCHLSPVTSRVFADPLAVKRDLSILATAYECGFVKILGGEPLLHPDLLGLMTAIRESGITSRIAVCTNGVLLDRMNDAFWSRVDEVEISVYPGHEPSKKVLETAVDFSRTFNVRLYASITSHFRESYSELGTSDRDLVETIFRTCKPAHIWRCHTVHAGHFFRCPQSATIPMALASGDNLFGDAMCLMPVEGLANRLLTYLTSTEPLLACRNCLGSAGRLFPHVQIRRRQWREPQTCRSEDLLDATFLDELKSNSDAYDGCVADRVVLCCES